MSRRSSAVDSLPLASPGGHCIRRKSLNPGARADSRTVSGGGSAFPADRGGDRDARRYPGAVNYSPGLSSAACSSSVPALRVLRINRRQRSTRRPVWIRGKRQGPLPAGRGQILDQRPTCRQRMEVERQDGAHPPGHVGTESAASSRFPRPECHRIARVAERSIQRRCQSGFTCAACAASSWTATRTRPGTC